MKKQDIWIEGKTRPIPAVLWGEGRGGVLLAVHGSMSHKEDAVIARSAEAAERKGLRTLSFDLPRHGGRADEADWPCNPWNGLSDLMAAYRLARTLSGTVSVFACSLGAYLTLLARPHIAPGQLLFLSPVVSMERVIEGMMAAAHVTPGRLEAEGTIPLPDGQTLDWGYYRYVREYPIRPSRAVPMSILHGERDTLIPWREAAAFAGECGASFTLRAGSAHYFHTEADLDALELWLDGAILPPPAEEAFSL